MTGLHLVGGKLSVSIDGRTIRRRDARRNTHREGGEGAAQMEHVREAILSEATRLFAEQGFDATSVQDVVDAAGVTKGAFYYYFGSKNDLLYEIHQTFMAAAMVHVERTVASGLAPEEKLRAMIVALITDVATYQAGVTVFFREMHRLSPEHRKAIRAERKRYENYFRLVIETGQEEGCFRASISSRLQVLAILTMCNATYTWYRSTGPVPATDIGEAFADIVLAGIRETADEAQLRRIAAGEASGA
jgi:AcrR family transcriptional regulator